MKDWKWILFMLVILYAIAATMQCNQNRKDSDNLMPTIDEYKTRADEAEKAAAEYKQQLSRFKIMKAEADSVIKVKEKAHTELKRKTKEEIDRIKLESTDEAIQALRRELEDSLHPFKLNINDQELVAFTQQQTRRFRLTLAELPACSLQVEGLEDLLSAKDHTIHVRDTIIITQDFAIKNLDTALFYRNIENSFLYQRSKRQNRKLFWKNIEIWSYRLGLTYLLARAVTK